MGLPLSKELIFLTGSDILSIHYKVTKVLKDPYLCYLLLQYLFSATSKIITLSALQCS